MIECLKVRAERQRFRDILGELDGQSTTEHCLGHVCGPADGWWLEEDDEAEE